MIAAPSAGTCSAPSTRGRNSSRNHGPEEHELQQPVEHRVLLRHRKTTGAQAADDDDDRPRRAAPAGAARHFVRRTCDDGRQRRQGGASWASCPARSRSRPTAAPVGVVLSHGFTGSPQSLRPWAEHLAARGPHRPAAPAARARHPLAGPQRTPAGRTGTARSSAPSTTCAAAAEQVFACGLSMGGTLVTRLAEQRAGRGRRPGAGQPVARAPSARTSSTASPLLHRVVPSLRRDRQRHPQARRDASSRTTGRRCGRCTRCPELWPLVEADLGRVTAPVLLYRSRVDHVVEPMSGRLLREGARPRPR